MTTYYTSIHVYIHTISIISTYSKWVSTVSRCVSVKIHQTVHLQYLQFTVQVSYHTKGVRKKRLKTVKYTEYLKCIMLSDFLFFSIVCSLSVSSAAVQVSAPPPIPQSFFCPFSPWFRVRPVRYTRWQWVLPLSCSQDMRSAI